MRSDVTLYELTAPPTLAAVLDKLAAEPGKHTPIAGGTELMVALGVGRLQAQSLLSLQHLTELRFIRQEGDALVLGANTTFTDIRKNALIAEHLPLLAQSASWTGAIANQNRGTLGGNIVNASPAADNPPVLLVYEATITLVSAKGTRTLPYSEFHLGYKKTVLQPDELVHSVTIPLAYDEHRQYIRKVGTRNALAISKIALAGIAKLDGERIAEIRLGAASLTDRPVRCAAAEAALNGASLAAEDLEATIKVARAALATEAKPIDDIRSTARYRSAVAENLLEEFLRELVD
ncbi:MAG: FAD binding domain-containing protein [Acidobacteriaceae bacterium]|nr:FAD binding domain-containing protein [Acidobacteriaceae bacterium]